MLVLEVKPGVPLTIGDIIIYVKKKTTLVISAPKDIKIHVPQKKNFKTDGKKGVQPERFSEGSILET